MKSVNASPNNFSVQNRLNAPADTGAKSAGVMYEKTVKNKDGTTTTKLKNFSLNSFGGNLKAFFRGYKPMTKDTASSYMQNKGMSQTGVNTVLNNIAGTKYVAHSTFESTIKKQLTTETNAQLATLKKLTEDL